MIEEMSEGEEKYKLEKMENLMGDAGYASGKRNKKLKTQIYNKTKKYYQEYIPCITGF